MADIEGRNAVIEAFRAGRTIDRLYILDGCKDGPVMTIKREAAKAGTQQDTSNRSASSRENARFFIGTPPVVMLLL